MEHRYARRYSASLKALIYKNGLPMAIGRLRNVTRQGLFIESDYDNVELNQLVEIEFPDEPVARKSRRRCRALVVHRSANGIGLAVDDAHAVSCELMDDVFATFRPRYVPAFAARGR